jgi:hypothetical protein
METLTQFEEAALSRLLAGDHPVLEALREQAHGAYVRKRTMTGVGFFTDLGVLPGARRAVLPTMGGCLSDVVAEVDGLEHGAGVVLFVDDGYLSFLEGYSYDEPWPECIQKFTLRYRSSEGRDLSSLLS